MTQLDAFKKVHFFYNCPSCEVAYYCCPGMCAQTALCMLNPCTWVICFAPVSRAKTPTTDAVNAVLNPRGIKMHIRDSWDLNEQFSEKAVFSLL